MRTHSFAAAAAFLAAVAMAAGLGAQGSYVNYEETQVKPITTVTIGTGAAARTYCLCCNTPDNSVEVWRASDYTFVDRIPVGMAPVTIRRDPYGGKFYTCNFRGGSVTCFTLAASGSDSVVATIERTVAVGDEPADIAFFSNNECFVSLHRRGGITHLDTQTLAPVNSFVPLRLAFGPIAGLGVKAPRTLAALPDNRFYALNSLGGDVTGASAYNLGLFVTDPHNPPSGQNVNTWVVQNLGSANFGFAIDSTDRWMFAATQRAQNDPGGVDELRPLATGFVQTWLQVIDLVPFAPGGPPAVVAEQVGGPTLPKPTMRSINLNRDYSQADLAGVPASQALSQATDVVLVENPPGTVTHVVIAAHGSDKLAILSPDGNQPSGWAMTQVALPLVVTNASYSAVGPRGLAYEPVYGRVWVYNRLDNSLAVVNPMDGQIAAQRKLTNDPRPIAIRQGHKFLYNAPYGSGNGATMCASCHIDGSTDTLRWLLGNFDPPGPPFEDWQHDGDGHTTATMADHPNDKPGMVTQTLQGLVNSNLEPFEMQFVTTNAPYHWRGDKPLFKDFAEAFARLQGRATEPTAAEMETFTKYINTIHHPPNPEQWKDRTYKGDLGTPDDVNDGSGGLRGLKLFHILPVLEGRSCTGCHHMPDGSSNTHTLPEILTGSFGSTQEHIFETAATRNLLAREVMLVDGFGKTDFTQPFTVTGAFGLLHGGFMSFEPAAPDVSLSINDFIHRTFAPLVADPTKGAAIVEFIRQLDTGTAPAIGLAWTVDPDPDEQLWNTAAFALLEGQAREANIGVAVYVREGASVEGYWYRVDTDNFVLSGTTTTKSRDELITIGIAEGNVVIALGTPTGSERRIASLDGVAAPITGPAPDGATLTLLPMVPNTAFVGIAAQTGNWDPNHPDATLRFVWGGPGPEPVSLKSIRLLQTALTGSYGVPPPPLRHEPPRRLRIAGANIREGAKLHIGMATTTAGTGPAQTITFDLAPTGYVTGGGLRIWETAEELDTMQTMAWLCGGYWAPGVLDILQNRSPSQPLNPGSWNKYSITVTNDDGQSGTSPNWQTLSIADVR